MVGNPGYDEEFKRFSRYTIANLEDINANPESNFNRPEEAGVDHTLPGGNTQQIEATRLSLRNINLLLLQKLLGLRTESEEYQNYAALSDEELYKAVQEIKKRNNF